jgi:hypothetical protein
MPAQTDDAATSASHALSTPDAEVSMYTAMPAVIVPPAIPSLIDVVLVLTTSAGVIVISAID